MQNNVHFAIEESLVQHVTAEIPLADDRSQCFANAGVIRPQLWIEAVHAFAVMLANI